MKRKDRDISLKYHEILQGDPEAAVKSFALINERLKEKEITFGEEILPILLEPGFLDKSEIEIVNSMVGPFQIAIDKIIDIVIEKYTPASQTEKYLVNKVKDAIKISDQEMEILGLRCGIDEHLVMYRVDYYLDEKEGFKVLEFNTDSAGGIQEADTLCEILGELPQIQELKKEYEIQGSQGAEELFRMIASVHDRIKSEKSSVICVTGLRSDSCRSEHINLVKFFTEHGYPAVLADPRDIEFRHGELLYDNKKISMLHRRLIFSELLDVKEAARDFIQGIRALDLPVINPFSSAIGSNKAILAILSSPEYHPLFGIETIDAVNHYLPWTRLFNASCDSKMIKMIEGNKDRYVLKKCISYGGTYVKVGRSMNEDEWKATISAILEKKESWIVQGFLEKTKAGFPMISEQKLTFKDMIININPFIIDKKFVAGIFRVSPEKLFVINVSLGGAELPLMVYSKKL
jgi:glutathionylspermidine synthase